MGVYLCYFFYQKLALKVSLFKWVYFFCLVATIKIIVARNFVICPFALQYEFDSEELFYLCINQEKLCDINI
jgi:hypothetical protein